MNIEQENGGQNQISSPDTAYTDTSQSISEEIPQPPPMVAVSGGGGNIPSWFYLIFGITLVAFFLVTSLLIFSFFSKKATSPSSPSFPTPTPVLSPFVTTTPTPVTSYLNEFKRVSDSDSLNDIERDITQTDFDELKKEVVSLDSELDFTP